MGNNNIERPKTVEDCKYILASVGVPMQQYETWDVGYLFYKAEGYYEDIIKV